MAKATNSGTRGDAITLLKKDHAMVEELAKEFGDAEADGQEQETLAERICNLLTVHTTIEEEIFYPAARESLRDQEDEDLLSEAEVEHAAAKELIERIENMSAQDEHFKATVMVLTEYVQHHVQEEEGELFPRCKKSKEMDLNAIGQALASRRRELMEEFGLAEESEERESAAATGARTKKSRGAHARSSARSRGH